MNWPIIVALKLFCLFSFADAHFASILCPCLCLFSSSLVLILCLSLAKYYYTCKYIFVFVYYRPKAENTNSPSVFFSASWVYLASITVWHAKDKFFTRPLAMKTVWKTCNWFCSVHLLWAKDTNTEICERMGTMFFLGFFLKLKLLRSLVPRIELNKSIQDQETPFYDLEVLGNALLFFEKKPS